MSEKRYIHIQKSDREAIMKAFGVTEKTVFNAIWYDEKRGNTDMAWRIRKMAMERGGIVMVVVPEVETLHDAGGYMRQYFPNGALFEVSKYDGHGTVWFKGERMREYDNVAVREMDGIQTFADSLK